MSRWNLMSFDFTNFPGMLRRGITSLFICLIVMLPLIMGAYQAWHSFIRHENRPAQHSASPTAEEHN